MGTGTHHHDTAFSIVKALGIVAVVISHAAILTPLETFTYYFNTAVFFFVAGYFFDDGQTAAPGRFIGRKLRRLYLPYVVLGTLFVLLHNRFLEWHLIAYDFSAREAILPYDTPELLRTLGRVFLFLHHEQMQAPFWFLQGLFLGLMLFFCITLATRKLAPTPTVAERLRGGSILFLFTVAMLLARHPSGIPGEWIAVRTFAITGIIYLGKLFRIFRARLPLDGRIATLCLVILLAAAAAGCRINLGGRLFGNPVLFVVLVCTGCYMLVTAASRLAATGNRLTRMLEEFSEVDYPSAAVPPRSASGRVDRRPDIRHHGDNLPRKTLPHLPRAAPAGRAHRNALPGHPARGGSRRLPHQPWRETFRQPGALRRAGVHRMLHARHRRKPPRGNRQQADTDAGLYGTAHHGDHAVAHPRIQTGDTLSNVGLRLPAPLPGLPPGHPHRVALVVDTLHRGRNHPAAGLLPAVRPAHTIRSMVMSGFSRSRST